MSLHYQAVGWNPQKKAYDRIAILCAFAWIAIFVGFGAVAFPQATAESLLIRAFGTAAFFLLHVVLLIGPLARLDPRFLPLLYNRRHLGVTTFLFGAVHGGFSWIQFHALGNVDPLVSLLVSETRFDSLHHFPFQLLGAFALVILFVMAATSHDFWLENLSARVWKTIHMSVYLAYFALVAHVALGVLQAEAHPFYGVLLAVGSSALFVLHLLAARQEWRTDTAGPKPQDDGSIDVCATDEIALDRARICASPKGGERIAVFRHAGGFSAISNVCRHQGGPLGEGRIVDGCVTCPWHGYQYRVESGTSPPPFSEKVSTYRVKIAGGRVRVDTQARPPGTSIEPAREESP